jgi:Tfp pilus assembly protein PilF
LGPPFLLTQTLQAQIVSVVLRSHPTDELALAYKAQFHANNNQPLDAVESALRSLAFNSRCVLAWLVVANVFQSLQGLAMAERCFLVALSCDHNNCSMPCSFSVVKVTPFY